MEEVDEIIREFLVESYENLERLDQELLALEQAPSDLRPVGSIFRTIHTIKGNCSFLGLRVLESVTHVGENLLSRLRDGVIPFTPERASILLRMVDAVRSLLKQVELTGNEGGHTYDVLKAELAQLTVDVVAAPEPAAKGENSVKTLADTPETKPSPSDTDVKAVTSDPQPKHLTPAAQTVVPTPTPGVATSSSSEPELEGAGSAPESAAQKPSDSKGGVSDTNIRVDINLLEKLMNLVGELVLTRNQIVQRAERQEDTVLLSASQRLNQLTTELQEGMMKARMQPIGTLWTKLPRVVRDLAKSCEKQVRVEMDGKETELDRTIIEALKDPLTHMVRNSIDHGIERPAVRTAAGKHAEGVLLLRAFHEGGLVNIEVSDDGAGIDPERIRQKALSRGLISPEQAARMGEHEVMQLIFLPGFSTAEQVTHLSGRGVGMDVVKTNIEKVGGSLVLQSRLGAGTSFRLKIPLTLAIIPALIVRTGGERFAIPQVNLRELIRLDGPTIQERIDSILGTPVCRLRGGLLPLIDLHSTLQMDESIGAFTRHREVLNIVVVTADARQFGLVVDDICDTQEIVVKPLGKTLESVKSFAGATIMGDGRVVLILDMIGLAQRGLAPPNQSARQERQASIAGQKSPQASGENEATEVQRLLLFEAGQQGLMALPLAAVARLEEFPTLDIEWGGGQAMVQYRGKIMPLVMLSSALPERRKVARSRDIITNGDRTQVVVLANQDRPIGMIVERILDVVEVMLVEQRRGTRPGVLSTAIIQGRIAQLLDVPHLIQSVESGVLLNQDDQAEGLDQGAALDGFHPGRIEQYRSTVEANT